MDKTCARAHPQCAAAARDRGHPRIAKPRRRLVAQQDGPACGVQIQFPKAIQAANPQDAAVQGRVGLEAETGALYLERQEDVRRYSLILDYVRAQALGPAESRALIAQMADHTPD